MLTVGFRGYDFGIIDAKEPVDQKKEGPATSYPTYLTARRETGPGCDVPFKDIHFSPPPLYEN